MDSELARLKRIAAAENWENPASVTNYLNVLNRESVENIEDKPEAPSLSNVEKNLLILRYLNKETEQQTLLDRISVLRLCESLSESRAQEVLNRYSAEEVSKIYDPRRGVYSYFRCVFAVKDRITKQFWTFDCRRGEDIPYENIIYSNISFQSEFEEFTHVKPVNRITIDYVKIEHGDMG